MAKLLKLRRGTTTQHASFTGAEGEVTIDTTKDTAVVHDGSQAGGRPLLREDLNNTTSTALAAKLADDSLATTKLAGGALPTDVTVADANISGNLTIESADIVNGTIVNVDVNASAAIAGTKVSPDFGSQDITTTGNFGAASVNITDNSPSLIFTDSNANSDFRLRVQSGVLKLRDDTNSADRLTIASDGTTTIAQNLDVGAGVDVTGNITVSGTVDGRDVAADGSKLDGIDTGATNNGSGSLSNYLPLSGGTLTGSLSGTRADFFDNGGSSPTVKIATDDQSPWALQIRNDTYWNSDSNGFKCYQDNSGNFRFNWEGNGAFINAYFQQTNGGTTNTALTFDTSRAVHLAYQGNTKLSTTSSGVSITGDLTASGNVTAYSDQKLKTDISTINDSLGIVGKLRGVNYKWISNGQDDVGVIAQEVEKVVPEVVKETDDGTKTVDYSRIVSVLINAVNELKAEVEELKGGK